MTFAEYNNEVNKLIDKSEKLISDMKYEEAADTQLEIMRLAIYVKINRFEELESVLKIINKASCVAKKLTNLNYEMELAMLEMKHCPIQ